MGQKLEEDVESGQGSFYFQFFITFNCGKIYMTQNLPS